MLHGVDVGERHLEFEIRQTCGEKIKTTAEATVTATVVITYLGEQNSEILPTLSVAVVVLVVGLGYYYLALPLRKLDAINHIRSQVSSQLMPS